MSLLGQSRDEVVCPRLSRKDDGFTLVEMVLVLLLIGILISAAIYGYTGYQRLTNNSAAAQNYVKLMTAKIAWCSQNPAGTPPDLNALAPYVNEGDNTLAVGQLSISGVTPSGTLTAGFAACGAGGTLVYTSPLFGSGTAYTCTSTTDMPSVNNGICVPS